MENESSEMWSENNWTASPLGWNIPLHTAYTVVQPQQLLLLNSQHLEWCGLSAEIVITETISTLKTALIITGGIWDLSLTHLHRHSCQHTDKGTIQYTT